MAYYAGKRVSTEWQRVLIAAEQDRGRRINFNSGRRTLREQTQLYAAWNAYKAGRGPWAPVAAVPSPVAPHIRVGRPDHALDIEVFSGDADWFDKWTTDRGMPLANTVASEAWHKEAPGADPLRTFARKYGQGPKELRRKPVHKLKLSGKGLDLIKQFEGFRDTAYRASPSEEHLTIGWGHYGPDVKPGQTITREEGTRLLLGDTTAAQNAVRTLVDVPLTQPEFDSLTSFVFNVGAGAFKDSTLLKRLNDGRRYLAANELLRWDKAGGKTLLGLSRRRRAERALYLTKKGKQ